MVAYVSIALSMTQYNPIEDAASFSWMLFKTHLISSKENIFITLILKGLNMFFWDHLCGPKDSKGLGFRLLHLFNLPMLAKQGWNLFDNPSSLPAQILKAKYYPRSGFLDADVGYNPSFICKSILQSEDVTRCGTRWRIGNGTSVLVRNDLWLPKDGEFYVQTPMLEYLEDLQVKDLIREDALD
ncbi:uncharacterized mitochondrial protein AtMg00310-like [Rutidosis leptorrhynchoides]|uniref:uncharacterized mitochondrial protein AtMg00310-like n=1 Tax=Rutidosis leptorrhynchoides TaxID=125765 RepID=UPI003A9A19A7